MSEHFLIMEEGRSLYKIREGVTFLNHGSFGKCPLEVLAKQQALRDELEEEPVDFLARKLYRLLPEALAELAAFIGAPPHSVVFFRNVTSALNAAVRAVLPGLLVDPEDEVLTTDHEYGACDRLFVWTLEQVSKCEAFCLLSLSGRRRVATPRATAACRWRPCATTPPARPRPWPRTFVPTFLRARGWCFSRTLLA